jgi:excisionase family DNA binding protein
MPWMIVVVSEHRRTRHLETIPMQCAPQPIDPKPRNRHERRAEAHGRLAYPIDVFAEAVGVGRSKIYEEIRAGRLHAKKLGSRTLITAQAASDYLSQLPDFHAG